MIKTQASIIAPKLRPNRLIKVLKGANNGPTVVFFGGVHGNEPAGVQAIEQVLGGLQQEQGNIFGTVYGIAGNLAALELGVRYRTEDLNRIWQQERIEEIKSQDASKPHHEAQELREIYGQLQLILNTHQPPFYFIDIHTTSSPTSPFIVMNDSLLNRRFTNHYPLPKVLGIEEYLHGALLSYINELGYVSFGFESGQHNDPKAVEHTVHFMKFSLGLIGSMKVDKVWLAKERMALQKTSAIPTTFFEITYEHHINQADKFKMLPGYVNFQTVARGDEIAIYNGSTIKAKKRNRLFMPLYQKQGSEGFYFIRPIPPFFLWLSKQLRKYNFDHMLTWLPRISWKDRTKRVLLINTKVARFMAKSFFHLLGYRVRSKGKHQLLLRSREAASKDAQYPNRW